jgi:signal peptidase I
MADESENAELASGTSAPRGEPEPASVGARASDGDGDGASRARARQQERERRSSAELSPSGTFGGRALRSAYVAIFFFVLPFLLACILVWALTPAAGVEAQGSFAWLQNAVREQTVPFVIVAFTLIETALWFGRHKLPLANSVYPPLPDGVGGDLRESFERARGLIEEARRLLHLRGKELGATLRDEISTTVDELEISMRERPFKKDGFETALGHAEEMVELRLGAWRKSEFREYFESIGVAIGFAMGLRQFAAEAFKIPSGSMIPTLQIGDHIFVNKLVYGPAWPFSKRRVYTRMPPERGDVMVFQFPERPEQDFIKRVIAIPGDTLEAKNGHPWINGWEVPSCFIGVYSYAETESQSRHEGDLYAEFLGDESYLTLYDHSAGAFPETHGPFKVAEGEAWVMGDNRHNSHDSRMWFGGQGGGVPFANIKGRASFVWLSMGDKGIQWGRFGAPVMGRPRLPPAMAHLEAGLTKCLAQRPPVDKTMPPAPGTRPLMTQQKLAPATQALPPAGSDLPAAKPE